MRAARAFGVVLSVVVVAASVFFQVALAQGTRTTLLFSVEDAAPERVARLMSERLRARDIRHRAGVIEVGRVHVDLAPGVDVDGAIAALTARGAFALHLVDEIAVGLCPTAPSGVSCLPEHARDDSVLAVLETPLMDGAFVDKARAGFDEIAAAPLVRLRLTPDGAARFCEISRAHIGERIALVADGVVLSAPTVRGAICGGSLQISGAFTPAEAEDLALRIASPDYPGPVTFLSATTARAQGGDWGGDWRGDWLGDVLERFSPW